MSRLKEIRTLPVKLTDPDILGMSDRASSLHKEAGRLAGEAKRVGQEYKESINLINSEFSRLQEYIYNKEEPRKIECQWYINKALKTRVLRRLDTMQAIDSKPLEEGDLQQDLFEQGEEKPQEDPVIVQSEHKAME